MLTTSKNLTTLRNILLCLPVHLFEDSLYSLYCALHPTLDVKSDTIDTPRMKTPALTDNKRAIPNTLPAELWLTIFESLPEESLRSVVFVCHFFRWLAQPLLFHTLSARTSTILFDSYGRPTTCQLTPPYAEKTLSQIEFYLSRRIAPSVNTAIIKPINLVETLLAKRSRGIKDDGVIQRRVFRALGEFPNLTTLRLHNLTLSDADLAALASLDVLEHVTLDACDTSSTTPPVLPVRSLSIECRRANAESALKRLWNAFLQPSTLQELSIGPWSVVDNDVILSLLVSAGPWPCLRTFKIGYGATEADHFLDFLSQTPDLEELVFYGEDVIPLTCLPPDLVPKLRSYVGPVDTARDIMRYRKNLGHLRVYGSGNVNIIDSHVLLDRLKEIGELGSQLWTLHFEAQHLTQAVFELVCEKFPNLRALEIYAEKTGDVGNSNRGLADWLMEFHLSPLIEYISITTTWEERGADSISKEYMLLPTLSRRYQRLGYFHCAINSESYGVRWDCLADRRLKENLSKEEWMAERGREV